MRQAKVCGYHSADLPHWEWMMHESILLECIQLLRRYSLVTEIEGGFSMHPVVRTWCLQMTDHAHVRFLDMAVIVLGLNTGRRGWKELYSWSWPRIYHVHRLCDLCRQNLAPSRRSSWHESKYLRLATFQLIRILRNQVPTKRLLSFGIYALPSEIHQQVAEVNRDTKGYMT